MGKPMNFRAAASKERAVRDRSGPKQLARSKTMFWANGHPPTVAAMAAIASKARKEQARLAKSKKLAEQIGGRHTSAERVEHVPAEPVYVSPQRAAELQNRPSVSGRIVRRDPETGAIVAIGRFVRELVNGRYVTRWEDEVRA